MSRQGPLSGTLNRSLCELLDRVVALDPAASRALRKIEGRSLGVELLGPGIRLVVAVDDGRVRRGDPEGEVSLECNAVTIEEVSWALGGS